MYIEKGYPYVFFDKYFLTKAAIVISKVKKKYIFIIILLAI